MQEFKIKHRERADDWIKVRTLHLPDGSTKWYDLPEPIESQMKDFKQEEIYNYPGTIVATIL